MALNATVRAAVEIPSKAEMPVNSSSASALPNTFGNNWNDAAFRSSHHKRQVLRAEQTGGLGKTHSSTLVAPPPQRPEVATEGARRLLDTLERERDSVVAGRHSATAAAGPAVESEKFEVDDKALRFFAYFTEHVRESAVESVRTRNVSLTFFLSDETFIIQEPRVANSGLVGGTLLKRQRIPISDIDASRRDGSDASVGHITISDINVGMTIDLFGRAYHVFACDGFTREFLTAIGTDVPQDGPSPDDEYVSNYRANRVNGKTVGKSFESKDLSATLESLGSKGKCAQHYPGETQRAQRFVRDSGKVLSFTGLWRDEEGGVIRTLDVRFFVEDDTILIVEKPNPVTKGDQVQKTFLSRRRLPLSGKSGKEVELTFAGRINGQREAFLGSTDRYMEADDLRIGAVLNVFGRQVHLFSCDGYTREYMVTQMGVDPGETIDVTDVFPKAGERKIIVPPPTGFGSDEDSLASCSIQPKAKGKDMRGWREHGEQVLRFEMRLHAPEQPEDKLRKFLMTYFLADKEIQITEIAVRNTGFTGGRFQKKQRIAKTKGERDYYEASDFNLNDVVTLSGFRFEIVGMDDHSKHYRQFEATKGRDPASLKAVPPARLNQLLKAFREYVTVRFYTNTEAFRAFDRDHDGFISLTEMKDVLTESVITPHDEEAVALVKFFDREGDGRVSYKDFMAAVAVSGAPETPKEPMDADATRARATAATATQRAQRTKVLRKLYERFEGRCLNGFEMFRLISTMPRAYRGRQTVELAALTNGSKDTLVTPVQMRRGLEEVLGLQLSKSDMAVVLDFFFPELPKDEYEAPLDRSVRYGLSVAQFQQKLTQMSSMGQL